MANNAARPSGLPHETRRDILFVLAMVLLTVLFLLLPTGFEGAPQTADSLRARGRVVDVNNERLLANGPERQGEQQLAVQLLSGPFKGEVFSGSNNLTGTIGLDKFFAPGDTVLVALSISDDGGLREAQVYDHYRTGKTALLCALFFALIVLVMGWVGVKIVISLVFTAAALIRVLFPAMLRGWDPILAGAFITILLTAALSFLVGGLTRRGLAAFAGAMGGVLLSSALAFFFTSWFKIPGAAPPFSETLPGYTRLNLAHLFISGIFLASSGAMMDLSMAIASAM
jgi:uncharacterized membrane protein